MAEKTNVSSMEQMDKIYDDTTFFVDAITAEYGFYAKFIDSLGTSGANINIQRHDITRTVETCWIDAIEAALPALDTALRNPNSGIKETEEVLPIEFSHHINDKSLRHLAQHTDYISRIEDDMIIPSKILNVYYEENKQTYENKFLNTLIDRLYFFVDRRFSVLKQRGLHETELKFSFESPFSVSQFSNTVGKIKFSIEASSVDNAKDNTKSGAKDGESLVDRVARIFRVVAQYKDSPLVKSLEGAMVSPPIMRTNAIRKNKYLSQCLALWDFIESYDKVGYTMESVEKAEKTSDDYLTQLYSLLAMQYFMFAYNMNSSFREGSAAITQRRTEPIKPDFIRQLEVVNTEKFNIYDTEFKKIVNVFGGSSQRRLTVEEAQIRDAVAAAIKLDKQLFSPSRKKKKSASVKTAGESDA